MLTRTPESSPRVKRSEGYSLAAAIGRHGGDRARLAGTMTRQRADEGGGGVQRGAAGDAPLRCSETDAIAVLEAASRIAVGGQIAREELIRLQVGDGVDHQRHPSLLDDVDDVGTDVAELADRRRRD